MICYHVLFSGKVQGVGFRFFVLLAARDLGVTGWVRNLPDRSVEMKAEAEEAVLQQMISRVSHHFQGFIRDIHLQSLPASAAFQDFTIKD
jgi:acylphosphatase